jgi:hypothetical protein
MTQQLQRLVSFYQFVHQEHQIPPRYSTVVADDLKSLQVSPHTGSNCCDPWSVKITCLLAEKYCCFLILYVLFYNEKKLIENFCLCTPITVYHFSKGMKTGEGVPHILIHKVTSGILGSLILSLFKRGNIKITITEHPSHHV